MSSLREIFKYVAIISGNNIAVSVINFVTFIVMFNALGVYGFGLFTLTMSIVSFATFFMEMGLGKIIVSDVSKDINEDNLKKAAGLFQGYTIYLIILMAISFILVLLLAEPIAEHMENEIISALITSIGFLIILGGLKSIYTTAFQAVAEFDKFAAFLFIEALSKLGFVYFFTLYLGGTIENVLFAIMASSLFTLITFFILVPKQIWTLLGIKDVNRWNFWKTISKHGKWAIISSQLRNIELNIAPWIVEFFLGVNAVGIYGALIKVQVLVIRIFEPLETIFYPLISKFGKFDDSRKTIFRATKYIFLISIPFILGLMIFAEPVLNFVFGTKMNVNAFRILLFTVFIFILNIPMNPLFFNLKAQKNLAIVSAIILVSTFTIGSLLTFQFGIIGIAMNHVFTQIIAVLLKSRFIKKLSGTTYSIKELIIPDKQDKDLLKKIISNPKAVLGLKK